ncbi:MAG: alpha/beta fold hydrolase [Tetrasphaera sp.]
MTRLLFVHGAGGYAEDGSLAAGIAAQLGADLVMPRMPNEDMSLTAWSESVRSALATLDTADVLVGHSFGASVLLHVLSGMATAPRRAVLLAMPDWGPDGWDVTEYAVTGPEPNATLTLHHCRDDDVVPFDHLARNAARLPSATVRQYPRGGHQFAGLSDAIAATAHAS